MSNIQNVRAVGNPQRAYEFECELLGNTISGTLPFFKERVQNHNAPEKSTETIEINYKSQKSRYAGRDSSPGTFTITFWDDEDQSIYRLLNDWYENGISNSVVGGGVTKDLYAVSLVCKLLAHDSTTVVGTHRYDNVFPSSIGDITYDYSASEHKTFTVTFTYDVHLFE